MPIESGTFNDRDGLGIVLGDTPAEILCGVPDLVGSKMAPGLSLGKFRYRDIMGAKTAHEASLRLVPETHDGSQLPNFSGGVVSIADGEREHRIYEHPKIASGLEWEVVFSSRPATNRLAFLLSFPPGLTLHRQPAPSPGEFTPEGLIGGYVVHWHRSGAARHADGSELITYKTGKVCEIRRPKLIGDDGDWIWCDYTLSGDQTRLEVSWDTLWASAAKLPLRLDPEVVGFNSIGGSTIDYGQNYHAAASDSGGGGWTPGFNGTADTVYFYAAADESSTPVTLGYYDDSAGAPANLIGYNSSGGNGVNTAWCSQSLDAGARTISTGSKYFPAKSHGSQPWTIAYDAVAGYDWIYRLTTYVAGTMNDPWGSVTRLGSRKVSFYIEYTVAGGVPYWVFPRRSRVIGGGAA